MFLIREFLEFLFTLFVEFIRKVPNIFRTGSDAIFKAIEEISVRLVLGDILYANTIAGGIIFEDFVAVLHFSNTYVAQ